MMMTGRVYHTLKPIYFPDSKVLILGTMPSPKSRQTGFYYGHPQNRMWRVLAGVFEDEIPISNEDKINFLRRHRIAMWDVLAECDINGCLLYTSKGCVGKRGCCSRRLWYRRTGEYLSLIHI